MRASRVLLRWYKSFNTRYHGYSSSSGDSRGPWESYAGQDLPFIEIPLDPQITTIVGANESGKSHLLSAVAKAFTGKGIGEDAHDYAVQDICRYCAFEGLEKDVWPNIGIELSFAKNEEAEKALKALGVAMPAGDAAPDADESACTIILDGAKPDNQFAQVFLPKANSPSISLSRDKWMAACGGVLPALQFIDAEVALSNEVHVSQLLQMYEGSDPSPVYDPLALQTLAQQFLSLKLEANKPVDAPALEAFNTLRQSLTAAEISLKTQGRPKTQGRLETLLFKDVLDIRVETLQQIAQLGSENRGYVERLISEINHRIDERLDITHFWQQDDEFRLTVDYKSGFFFFEITDKTGAKYTFNERSSGLRYFLSYYIQAKAIERANETRGSIVLMDEPDSFLSIAGQRNLLQVFESLVSPKSSSGSCQLIYTTHSPFLINRNFPHRLCLVRKGDGNEGTQYVPRSGMRRYEPIRSALGVDCAETLFMGSTNIVVEGVSDQRVLVAAIQKFGDPRDVDALLNLNTTTFVSAGGATNVRRLVEKSITGDEKRPIVAVLLDGDNAGNQALQELTAQKIVDAAFVTTVDQLGLKTAWIPTAKVLEDMIPPRLLAMSIVKHLKDRWSVEAAIDSIEKEMNGKANTEPSSARIVRVLKANIGAEATSLRDEELKGELLDAFVDHLSSDLFNEEAELHALEENVRIVCDKLRAMIDEAQRRAERESLHKCVKLTVEAFQKSHHHGASRADVERCLQRLERECAGFTNEARRARENLNELAELLKKEVGTARAFVDMARWNERFRVFTQCPWSKPREGWPKSSAAPIAQSPASS